ncbi:uncharacterized protein EV420DRAFT_762730 [Desarmillaria tabescens]|uniref:Arrestin-like N-terminal domain-containing protein n=1 Tax=Armillaria tabescens TaxID=1929756 RepID=A0AA39MWL4_ARMTA|nr:uncharacterized protein EV420DRAFT_762730 [Desarmillaria tabescens]KAK0449746.1 hypothetical protein EV420DRAFT_762730 [Desarmillaria tabescens]
MDSLPPAYSLDPSDGESRIDLTPSRSANNRFTGNFLKKEGNLSVVLTEQQDGCTVPSYGRKGVINGAVFFERRDLVTSVQVKLEGRMETANHEYGSQVVTFLDETRSLWSVDSANPTACSSSVPFSLTIPSEFEKGNDKRYELPPSFTASFPELRVSIGYSLTVRVIENHYPLVGFLRGSPSLRIVLNYRPRTRPAQPMLSNPAFLSSVKMSPEEWKQSLMTINPKPNTAAAPIHCSLFIPAVQIFAVSDNIPFHVQLTAPLASLRQLFPAPAHVHGNAALQVHLVRQVSVEVDGNVASRNVPIGEGSLRPVPPLASEIQPGPEIEKHMDWEGVLRCQPDVEVGGFFTAGVSVKDFIIASLYPPASSDFPHSRNGVRVRIVTDPWTDEVGD